jgi:predicted dienelactone hydrolase
MKTIIQWFFLCLVWPGGGQAAETYTPSSTYRVSHVNAEWNDTQRARKVPVKIYYPASGRGPFPVVIFSHGLGGDRNGYSYLGLYWASCGYISVHLQHPGSDSAIWQNAGNILESALATKSAITDLRNAINRPLDVSFAIDRLTQLNGNPKALLRGKIDTNRIAVAGHSFGGFTSMAVAGQLFIMADGKERGFRDARVKAAIEMSAPKSFNGQLDRVYSQITIPTFHMTGTQDDSPVGETSAKERRLSFDHMNRAEEYLLTFQDGDHMVFSGRIGKEDPKDETFQRWIRRSSVAFLDGYLKGNSAAKAWLGGGEFAKELGGLGILERKMPKEVGSLPSPRPGS